VARRNFDDIPVVSWLAILPLLAFLLVATVAALMSVGAVYGAGTALVNYCRALRESIQPESAAV